MLSRHSPAIGSTQAVDDSRFACLTRATKETVPLAGGLHAYACYALQAGNLLREALGDLQTSEAILAKDQNLAGVPCCSFHGSIAVPLDMHAAEPRWVRPAYW